LTPPCYHLEPPATAALFSFSSSLARPPGIRRPSNHVSSFARPALDTSPLPGDAGAV